jgi:hypothetical protein
MLICVDCGIELEDGLKRCPLCGKSTGPEQDNIQKPSANVSEAIILERKKYLWELFGIFAFSAIAVCTIVDLVISRHLNWSLISDVVVMASWITLTIYLFARRKILITVPLLLITALSALFFIDLISPGREWFLPLALPLTLAFFFCTGLIIFLYKIMRIKGLNIISFFFIVLSGFCIIAEMIIDEYTKGSVTLRWSLIASISILPVALLIFYFHYRLKRGNRIDSFLHI